MIMSLLSHLAIDCDDIIISRLDFRTHSTIGQLGISSKLHQQNYMIRPASQSCDSGFQEQCAVGNLLFEF
jgi:hypothetical protein